jgi:hypothetical protein
VILQIETETEPPTEPQRQARVEDEQEIGRAFDVAVRVSVVIDHAQAARDVHLRRAVDRPDAKEGPCGRGQQVRIGLTQGRQREDAAVGGPIQVSGRVEGRDL